jgi:hypothetical protein
MFKKRWPWLGKLVSDEGFEISFGHKTLYYQDNHGKTSYQVSGQAVALTQAEIDQMVERVVRGITWEQLPVQVFPTRSREV